MVLHYIPTLGHTTTRSRLFAVLRHELYILQPRFLECSGRYQRLRWLLAIATSSIDHCCWLRLQAGALWALMLDIGDSAEAGCRLANYTRSLLTASKRT